MLRVLLLAVVIITPGAHTTYADPPVGAEVQQIDGNPFSTDVTSLDVDVPLGERLDIALTITNGDVSTSYRPTLYEALPAPPPGVFPRRVLPEELSRVALPEQSERVDTQILRDLQTSPDQTVEFLVFLAEQADISAAYTISDWGARGAFVYHTLYDHAERSQHNLRMWLEDQDIPYRPFWIVNALAVRGTAADLQALSSRTDIALLRANYVTQLELPEVPSESLADAAASHDDSTSNRPAQQEENAVAWNIRKIGADRVWYDFGVSGQGITVANNDNGVRYDHPALERQYRGYRSSNQFDHNYNWFDPNGFETNPLGPGDHGTHTMGTIVARGNASTGDPAYGVAPGAEWITARGCLSTTCADADLILAAQWLLAPTDNNGRNPRPDLRPHVVNNSWAGNSTSNWYIDYITAWRAAGMFPVFVTGNTREVRCRTVASPGDYANVLSVGGTDRSDTIAFFSRVGPTPDGRIKPDIVAPGQSIQSTVATASQFGTLSGTSMASPHVAGTVALLWAANPALIGDYDTTYEILTGTAIPITDDSFTGADFERCAADSVPNNIYGYGLLDSYAAVVEATVDVPWLQLPTTTAVIAAGSSNTIDITLDAQRVPQPGVYTARVLVGTGNLSQSPLAVDIQLTVPSSPDQATIRGSVTDRESGGALAGVVDISEGPLLPVDSTGFFEVTLAPKAAPYQFEVSSAGYVSQSLPVSVTAGLVDNLDIQLVEDIPRVRFSSAPITALLNYGEYSNRVAQLVNEGTQPLTYSLDIPSERFGVWRSDEPDGPATGWIRMPADAKRVRLRDDSSSEPLPLGFAFPFYTDVFTSVHVNSNGLLVFDGLDQPEFFIPNSTCLPVPETDRSAIIPLRADLDPAQGGRVRYAQIEAGFLVSFERVPLHGLEPGTMPTFTFQVLLAPDGRVLLNYRDVGALPESVTIGTQRNENEVQLLGCGRSASVDSGLTLELRPQPDTQRWITLPQTRTGSLPPGAEEHILIRLGWVSPRVTQPYRGTVTIASNDPRNPLIQLPVELQTTPSPYVLWLPMTSR